MVKIIKKEIRQMKSLLDPLSGRVMMLLKAPKKK